MKKLLFSTMAVLAFSVSGMANTVELEELIKSESSMALTIKAIDCDKVASDVWWSWWGNGFSAETADAKKAQAKKDCEDEKAELKKKGLSID
jgi:hypothetical protein